MKNIKELLLEGCTIKMEYKEKKNEYVGDVSLYIFPGYWSKPKIALRSNYIMKEWEIDQIDEAIEFFEDMVFNKNNLQYKMNETIRELTLSDEFVDLEIKKDYDKVRSIIDSKISKLES